MIPEISHSGEPQTLQNLPFDMKDQILSLLDSPRDLFSFSLSSKEWASLIVPAHIEYREIRIRANRLAVWKHLAKRTDLAKNIRSLWLMSSKNETKEVFPRTLVPAFAAEAVTIRPMLVDGVAVGQLQNKRPLPEMVKAIRNFRSLRGFMWTACDGHGELVEEIFEALGHCRALAALRLGDVIVNRDYLGPSASLWKLSNLTELVLSGKQWPTLGCPDEDGEDIEDSLVSMLNLSPNLKSLTLTYFRSHPRFPSSSLQNLSKLHLLNIPGLDDTPVADSLILHFLQTHPAIEDLKWYPVNERMRKMECVSQISLGSNTIQLMGQIDASRLEEVHLWRYDGLEAIKKLAELCPSIRTLLIPNFGLSYTELSDCVECLAHFPNLEAVLESSLWLAIRYMRAEERTGFIERLLTLCPKLKRISHLVSLTNMVHDIVFERSVMGGVTWRDVPSEEDWI
ncbi:hypothetical protein CPB84DRAFT_1778999 [Gymnopilus junonius]|uniref:F-box domain-containing protein n=1 Tax=Gymnopilus junonius TaxID=109634 RepID=A0A9P5TM20_GYMJU|nr:hypothetical protein CPB84DRAFT_1778999 [Gymnopilus junonius]